MSSPSDADFSRGKTPAPEAPRGLPAPGAGELDVRYYGDLLWRGRTIILASAVVGISLGVLVGFLQTPEYRATAMVQIEPPTPLFMNVTDALVGSGGFFQNADFYNTQFKILRSKGIGDAVVERLKLKDQPPFKDAAEAGALLMSHVTVDPVPETRLVNVQVLHEDPQTAALWANTVAAVYIDQSIAGRVESAKRAADWLQERLAATQQSMKESQDKYFKGLQSQDIYVPEGAASTIGSSISKLNDDYLNTEARKITLEAAIKQVAEMKRRGQGLDHVPQIAGDSLVMNLNSQITAVNLELSRLKEKYREAHPEVQKAQALIDQARKDKDKRAEEIVAALQAEYAQLQRKEAELRTAIDAQKAQAATQSRKVTEIETMKKEADSSKSLYDVLLQKLHETDIAGSIRSNNVSLVEKAVPPSWPLRPEKRKIALFSLLMGVGVGVLLVLLRDYLDDTLKDPDETERYLHLNLLAAVPRYNEANVHLVTEAYQNLRTALIFGRKDDLGQVVLIAGSAPQEGKTTTLVNIAKLLAASGEKTITLDFDLRRASLHHQLKLRREPGLTNYFVSHEELDTLVQPTGVPNLYALTAGPLPPNPPALLARKSLPDFLDRLRRHFEWILMDSPPLASVTDALLLARHADLVVVVVQYNKVDKKLVKRSVAALRKANANLLGAVLNAVDAKAQGYYYYYYHQERPDPAGVEGRKAKPRPVAAARR